ncbi:hypothetical protein PXD56_01435 [Maribacter sp. SA7]|uniref:hypothetical protein n=1 Tax=Maribacter zhoushanensis TaxID=3030012 RepID=UPI0023EBAFA2|nr:hypothetical protein [Maribacter zhoushanensis]MDF4201597.1 hypothetical protein [Maribacter zhoushanensis]
MKKRILHLVFLFLVIQISCETDNGDNVENNLQPFSTDTCESLFPTPDSLRYEPIYGKPIITQPINSIFYSNEIVEIGWNLPDNLWNTELQIIQTNNSFDCNEYGKFHELNNNFSAGYGNQYVHYYSTTEFLEPIQDSIFVSYRARTTDIESPQGYSKWTDVKSFSIVPLSNLNKVTITVPYTSNFITEESNNEYYSGIISFPNARLTEIANDFNLDYNKIRLVRLINIEGNFITQFGNGENPFSKLILGFNEDINTNENVYPFEVFGEIFPGSFEESPVTGNLYNNLTKNLVPEMNNYDLKMAYVLEDIVGSPHEIFINLTFEIFNEN